MRSHAIRIGVVVVAVSAALWGGSGVASAGGGCMHSTGPTTGRGDTVELQDMCFTSTVLSVEPGTDVTWINRDPMGHNVVGVGGTWGSLDLTLNQGDTVSNRFDEEGVFPYACWIHPGMIGAIVVGDGVGTGLAGVVPGSGSDAGSPASTEGAAAPVAQDGTVDTTVIWIAGAALVLAGLGGGAFAIAARNRRKGALAG
jgi:plastocyanin